MNTRSTQKPGKMDEQTGEITSSAGETQTQHGTWTPETAQEADREVQRVAEEPQTPQAATESVDKSKLDLPREQRPIDH